MSALAGARREVVIGIAWLAAVVTVYTSVHLVVRAGLQFTLTSYDLTSLRFIVGGAALAPLLLRTGFGNLKWWQALLLAAAGGPGFVMPAYGGYHFAPAAHGGAILSGALPLFTAPLAWWLAGERLGTARTIALVVILAGALAMIADAVGHGGPGQWIGDALFFAAAVSWAIFIVLMRKWDVPALRAGGVVGLFSLVVYMPLHFALFSSNLAVAPWREIAAQAVYQGLIVSIISTLGFAYAVRALGATLTTMAAAIVPTATAVLAWLLLGEPVTALAIAGIALVTVGILGAVSRGGARRTGNAMP